jgi:hypothetical protein
MPQKGPRKSPAQLQREIAQVLSRKPSHERLRTTISSRTLKALKTKRAHAVKKKKSDPKQADTRMVANDAALEHNYDRAEKVLGQGKQRAIATAYTTITPESAAESDHADRGWVDEDGEDIEVTADDIAEAHETNSNSGSPVTDAIVGKAVRWLRDQGAYETSSSDYHPGVWYSTSYEVSDYSTGEERQEDFFLRNFSDQEEKRIFDEFKKKRR